MRSLARRALGATALLASVCAVSASLGLAAQEDGAAPSLAVEYLEIVTSDVEGTIQLLEKTHGVTFSEPNPGLGGARTAALRGGGRLGVRGSLAEHDIPVVRPYFLVPDLDAAVEQARAGGGEVAMGPTDIPPGPDKFSIFFLGGVQHGLYWR